MSAIAQSSRPVSLNRRRRVRQKVHAPAYASFSGASRNEMLDLYEVLDISEVGVAVQCAAQMELNQQVELCLDLAESGGQISTIARVVWSDSSGRAGLGFPTLTNSAVHRLREWLFLNAMAGAANAASATAPPAAPERNELRPNYTDTLTATSAVQREAEGLGADLAAVLSLVASRSQSLLRASGAAIALTAKDDGTVVSGSMICRASSGPSAPPLGATLQVGSGFSGECVRTGRILRCDDSETDERVDRLSCRALGIRSMLAAPVRMGERVIGLLEVFSEHPSAFGENDTAVLQRFSETILAAINRAARAHDAVPPPAPPKPFTPAPGSVLFAHAPEEASEQKDPVKDKVKDKDEDKVGGIRLPRAHLFLLIAAIPAIALALGYILAPSIQPWVQEKLQGRGHNGEQTVLASSRPPGEALKTVALTPSVDSASLDQLRDLAKHEDPEAENRLGRIYAEGDEKRGVKPDDSEAAHWFTKAAEHGSVSAQYKLGLLYWGGHHGVPKDINKAYFWAVLARAGGQQDSKDLANFIASDMTRAQTAAIEQEAENWYHRQEARAKPEPGR
jgi:GAF domain-containing protein/PilZ domain-containing protein/Sel1 repeat-containing protein